MSKQRIREQQQGESFQKFGKFQREQNEEIISQQSSKLSRININPVKKPKQREIPRTHAQLMKDPIFRSAFTIHQRTGNWIYNCFRCLSNENSYVSILDQQERKYSPGLTEDLKRQLKDRILKLKIIQSSRLELDPNVMHPFVKIHIVNKNNGEYLKVFEGIQTNVFSKQQITCLNDQKQYQTHKNNILLPFATNCCDFRTLGDSRGAWNQKFFINTKAQQVLHPDTLMLFQILDFNHQALLYKDTDIYDKQNFYRVAWGFLRPVGIGKNHIGKTKVQLFRYKFRNKKVASQFSNNYVPSVYYDFIWNNHEKYEGFLTVQLIIADRPKVYVVGDTEIPRTIFDKEKGDEQYVRKFVSEEDRRKKNVQMEVRQDLLKFYRTKNCCEVPKQMIYKLESSTLGCYRVKFIGNYIFAACSDKHTTAIKVYSLENGQKVMTMKGHRQIIYDIATNANPADGKETHFITSGSDHFVRIWKIPENYGEYIDQDESQQYLAGQCLHTAAVYSSAGILINLEDIMYTVTCCYDGYIRLWETTLTYSDSKRARVSKISKQVPVGFNQTRPNQKVYPTCVSVSTSNQFYVGDSIGIIRIFNFQKKGLYLQSTVTNPQLSLDAVLTIQIVQRHLFVQSSDNMIRRFQLNGSKLYEDKKYAGGQFQNLLLNCKISPDFKYLLAPSQSGKPVIWDVFTGTVVDIDYFNLSIKGPLTCCDWHPKYNLIVVSGFTNQCPIFIYGNVLNDSEIKIVQIS